MKPIPILHTIVTKMEITIRHRVCWYFNMWLCVYVCKVYAHRQFRFNATVMKIQFELCLANAIDRF